MFHGQRGGRSTGWQRKRRAFSP